jgi:hypothetical protein
MSPGNRHYPLTSDAAGLLFLDILLCPRESSANNVTMVDMRESRMAFMAVLNPGKPKRFDGKKKKGTWSSVLPSSVLATIGDNAMRSSLTPRPPLLLGPTLPADTVTALTETALDAEVMFLRACLESSEAEIKEEKARAEVDRGTAKGNELKMREEMKKLELEIENSHDKKAERELQGKVALLRVQLKTAEDEVSRVRDEAVTHALKSDLSMSKLSSEMGLMSAKIPWFF